MRRLVPLTCLLAIAVLPAVAAGGKFEGPPKGVLVGLLLPYSEQAPVLVISIQPRGETASLSAYGTGLEPGRYSWGVTQTGICKSSPKLLGARFGGFRAKSQDVAVENDETHWVGHDRARSIVLLKREGDRHVPVACGALKRGRGGVAHATGDVSLLAAAASRERRTSVRAFIECATARQCRRLMEEEGIFYFARQPCGTPATGKLAMARAGTITDLDQDLNSVRSGNTIVLQDVLVSSLKGLRSARVALNGRQLACGALG
jgi:hypothetical protein